MSTSYNGPSYNGSGYNGSYSQPSAGYAEPTQSYGPADYGQDGYQNYASTPYSGQAGAVQPYSPYAAAPVLPDHPNAVLVLVLGIISVVGMPLTGPFAWYFGAKARKEVKANPGAYKDSSMLTAGWVMGIIGTVLLILAVVFWIFYIIFIVAMVANVPR